jgi:hypothetical protein
MNTVLATGVRHYQASSGSFDKGPAVHPNWAEQVTAIATSVGAFGLLGAIGAAIFAGRQVREAQKTREAQMAAEFFRRWNDEALVETRRLIDRLNRSHQLGVAFQGYVRRGAPEAYVLYRELDYFEQLAALEHRGVFDFELIKLLLGRTLIARWEMWEPALRTVHGAGVYPMFEKLVGKMRTALAQAAGDAPRA